MCFRGGVLLLWGWVYKYIPDRGHLFSSLLPFLSFCFGRRVGRQGSGDFSDADLIV